MAIHDAEGIRKKNIELQKLFKKYFTLKYTLLLILSILLLSLYKDIIKGLILVAFFTPLVVYSLKASKFIPNLNIEVISASALLLGYMFGSLSAIAFGLIIGFYGIFKSNYVTYLFIVRIIVTAAVAGIMPLFFHFLSFNWYFVIGILLMNVILYFLYLILDPDPLQNTTHRISHLFWNLFVVRFLYVALYELIKNL